MTHPAPLDWALVRIGIGARLRAERERLGLTQAALAELLGVRRLAVLKYETGDYSPTADQLQALDQIGADVGFVVTGRSCQVVENTRRTLLEEQMKKLARECAIKGKAVSPEALLKGAWMLVDATLATGRGGPAARHTQAEMDAVLEDASDAG